MSFNVSSSYSAPRSTSSAGGRGSRRPIASAPTPSVSSCTGELLELPTKHEIMQALTCPVCQEVCVPPIWNCVKGHIICNTCRPHLINCALCRETISESRNYPLENIALCSKFQCQYKLVGCDVILSGSDFSQHVKNCLFRHIQYNRTSEPSVPASMQNLEEHLAFNSDTDESDSIVSIQSHSTDTSSESDSETNLESLESESTDSSESEDLQSIQSESTDSSESSESSDSSD